MATKHFIWNFSLDSASDTLHDLLSHEPQVSKEALKWEVRFFFSEDEEIILRHLGSQFLWCSHYRFTTHKDVYILSPEHDRNIKYRKKALAFKPLVRQEDGLCAYRKKERYKAKEIPAFWAQHFPDISFDAMLMEDTSDRESYRSILVYKEALVHRFSGHTGAKIELSRIACLDRTFTSVCIESNSKVLTHALRTAIIPGATSISYVQFLKRIMDPSPSFF